MTDAFKEAVIYVLALMLVIGSLYYTFHKK